ncbi:cyclic pyranopterin monophosphate synthase MoaC [bacterium]|nr:MAG: cyclic pyranopterin monophosphate synthase MoaC [bacterium]
MSRAALTHLDGRGAARMVDVGAKDVTRRRAVAKGSVTMSPTALRLLRAGALKKGDALAAARLAGIMAAKKASDLIPLCHPLPIDSAAVRLSFAAGRVEVEAEVTTSSKTGVEMEALTAVAAACLTLYDMAKAEDRGMVVGPLWLAEKSGGRSGTYRRLRPPR